MTAVLALDTSSRRRTVCVVAGADGELISGQVREGEPVGTAVPAAMASLLPAELAAVVVVVGPGSYTGLRAGMAAALGLAQALALPLHGVGTLEVVAAGWERRDGEAGLVVADAGRGAAYVAGCTWTADGWVVGDPRRAALPELAGSRAPVASCDPLGLPGVDEVEPAHALARAVPIALRTPALQRERLRALYVT